MTQIDRMEAVDDHWCLEDFAEVLIRRLGVDGAVEACRTNLWHGCLIPAFEVQLYRSIFRLPGTGLSPKSFPAIDRMLHHSALGFRRPYVFHAMADAFSSARQA